MSEKHSIASKARWAGIPEEERRLRMQKIAQLKWDKMTVAEKLRIGRELIKKRWSKKTSQ